MMEPSHVGIEKLEVKPSTPKCAWCLQSSVLNNFVLPMKKETRFFCSLLCLQEFKQYMCCGHCATVTSSCDLSLRVTLKSSRKGFCSLECLEGFKTKIVEHNPEVIIITPPKRTSVALEREIVTPHTQFLAAVIKQEKDLIKMEKAETGENKKLLSQEKKPTPTKSPHKSGTPIPSFTQNDFSWDKYLNETGSFAASQRCFNQNAAPLTNEFAIGMKLEAQDPRNRTSYCIASVIDVLGPRIQLRLDGSDDGNDFWQLVDSETIHPIGYCKSQGKVLQAPLGFLKNPFYYASFMEKILAGADLAPIKCFKPVPKLPNENFFNVGDKLEAVDRKYPELICPATIVSVKNDRVQIHFDGFESACDYWCSYDSRDLFPVGWCDENDHPIEAPGPGKQKKTAAKRSISYPDPSPSCSEEKKAKNRRVKINKLEETITGALCANAC